MTLIWLQIQGLAGRRNGIIDCDLPRMGMHTGPDFLPRRRTGRCLSKSYDNEDANSHIAGIFEQACPPSAVFNHFLIFDIAVLPEGYVATPVTQLTQSIRSCLIFGQSGGIVLPGGRVHGLNRMWVYQA